MQRRPLLALWAAGILLASEKWAGAHGQVPQAWLIDAETAAVDYFGPNPEGLLMAPVYAVPRLLDRAFAAEDINTVTVHCVVETRDAEHIQAVKDRLNKEGFEVSV